MATSDCITVSPLQCGGRPGVRGMRIRMSDVLDLLAAGLSPGEVVSELPDLEPADVAACLCYASLRDCGTVALADISRRVSRVRCSGIGRLVKRGGRPGESASSAVRRESFTS